MAQGLKFDNQGFTSLLNATGAGAGQSVAMHNCKQVGWFTAYSGTVSAGTIVIEWHKDRNFSGAWQQLAVIDAANLAAGTDGSGTYPGPIDGFMRANITSPITGGGNVTVTINGLLA